MSSGPLALTFINPYVESVTMTGCIFAIAGIGLFITIASGQFSIAHAALMGLGGYAAALASTTWGELSFWLAILFGALVGAVSGVILALLLRRMGGMLLAVATLAIGVALSFIVSNIDYLGGSLGFPHGIPVRTQFWPTVGILGFILVCLTFVKRGTSWLALIAVGKNEIVAEALGISVLRARIWGFGIGGALAGLAGGLLAQFLGFLAPTDLGFAAEAQLFIYVIIGGITTAWGPVVGAIGITWMLELLRFSVTDRYWILGLLLMVVVLLKPQGLLVRRNLRARRPGQPWWDLSPWWEDVLVSIAQIADSERRVRVALKRLSVRTGATEPAAKPSERFGGSQE